MNAYNYLKLDIRSSKSTLKFFILAPVILILVALLEYDGLLFMTGWIGTFYLLSLELPFTAEMSNNTRLIYTILPGKIKSRVLGRYLYMVLYGVYLLCTSFILLFIADYIEMLAVQPYLYFSMFTLFSFSMIVGLIEYCIYYKVKFDGQSRIAMLLRMIPAFSMMVIGSMVSNRIVQSQDSLSGIINFAKNNWLLVIGMEVLIVIAIITISFSISCKFCAAREDY